MCQASADQEVSYAATAATLDSKQASWVCHTVTLLATHPRGHAGMFCWTAALNEVCACMCMCTVQTCSMYVSTSNTYICLRCPHRVLF